MTTFLLLLGTVAALGLSAFFSGVETGVYCLNRVRLNVLAGRGRPRAVRLLALMKRPQELVITTLLGTNCADYLATVCITTLLLHATEARGLAEIYATALLTPLVLVFGGVIPKDWFQRESGRLMQLVSLPLAWCLRVACWTGLVGALDKLTQYLIRVVDPLHAETSQDLLPRLQMHRLLSEGAASGGLSAYQRETLDRVMNISRVRLADVMAPRARAIMVPLDIPRDDLLRIARMAHFSRLPVYRDDPRHIVGVVNVYHVLMDNEEKEIAEYIQPAEFLNAAETVPAALLKLQKSRQVMAIVTNNAGDCLGLVTIKDLVEEIVGELEAW